jgi:hypothetical protein
LSEGRPRLGILSRLIASLRGPPPSGTGEPPAQRE